MGDCRRNLLGKMHKPKTVNVNRTYVMSDGRGTIFEPCKNRLFVREHETTKSDNVQTPWFSEDQVFNTNKNDEKIGLSIENKKFLDLMNTEIKKATKDIGQLHYPFALIRETCRITDLRRGVELKF